MDITTATASPGATRERLDRMSGLHRLHVVVALGSLLLTLGAWQFSRHALEERNRARFDRAADHAVEELAMTLDRQAGLLRAAAGFVESSGDDAHDAWRAFSDALDLERRFPALGGLAAVRSVPREAVPDLLAEQRRLHPRFALRPEHAEPVLLPIVLVAREDTAGTMLGYDLAFSRERREAAASAFETNEVRLTAPVRPGRGEAAGVVMLAPYRGAAREDGGDAAAFRGVVATSMLFERLVSGALAPARREVRLRIRDAGQVLVDETVDVADPEIDAAPLFRDERLLSAYGREWRVDIETTLGFRANADLGRPWIVIAAGLVIDALLITLLRLHLRGNRRLLAAARQLRTESLALARSNELLETFACVVSHDLKAPLTGIALLIDVVEEDVRDPASGTDEEVVSNLARMRARVARAEALIEDVLDYSGLGVREETTRSVDPCLLLEEIRDSLHVDRAALRVECGTGPIDTIEGRLRQVLANLVGNAFKYHDRPGKARVLVRVEDEGDRLRFSVVDNGPGIAPGMRERVFDPFVSAHGTERPDSTGVGLAIVRRSVETMGGVIEVSATPGGGTTFAFTWPREVVPKASEDIDGTPPPAAWRLAA